MNTRLESDKIIKERKLIRNEFPITSSWGIPILKGMMIDDKDISFLAYSSTKKNDINVKNLHKTVHFFIDDSKFQPVYNGYNINQIKKLAQYKYVLTPDFSVRTDMPLPVQINNVFKSRWCGALWQDYGIKVIPTISWSDERSYDFCFEGIEQEATVAISTLGCKSSKGLFMKGYEAMMGNLKPKLIICYDRPFEEMQGNIIHVKYIYPRGGKSHRRKRI